MKTVILSAAIFFYLSTFLSAQITNTWKGGAPGHETDWHFTKTGASAKRPMSSTKSSSLTLTGIARLFTEKIDKRGDCTGCEGRVWVEPDPEEAGFARN
jgi:hypothetical protein